MMEQTDRRILKIALPSIVSNITVPLLGLVDVAITGHLGSAVYLGAIAVGGMLFNIIYWMFAFLRMSTSGLTAQSVGRRDVRASFLILNRSVSFAFLISFFLLLLSPIIRDIALWLIAPGADVAAQSRTYFNICIWGAPPSLAIFALSGWFIGMQNSRYPMFMAIVQNVVNIAVSSIFVLLMGMKVEGVAMGTVIAQWTGLLVGAILLLHDRQWRAFLHLPRREELFDRIGIVSFFSVSKDIFFRTLCLITVHFAFISFGAKIGDMELAVNTVLMQLFTLFSYFMDGFANAGEALVGEAVGAVDGAGYKRVLKRLFVWAGGTTVIFTTIYLLAGEAFLSILTDNESVRRMIGEYRCWTVLFPLCGVAAFVWDGVCIGATRTRQMLVSVFVGMLTFFVSSAVFIPLLGNHGLWLSFLLNLTVRGGSLTLLSQRVSVC